MSDVFSLEQPIPTPDNNDVSAAIAQMDEMIKAMKTRVVDPDLTTRDWRMMFQDAKHSVEDLFDVVAADLPIEDTDCTGFVPKDVD